MEEDYDYGDPEGAIDWYYMEDEYVLAVRQIL
jgi:hypothetical protein